MRDQLAAGLSLGALALSARLAGVPWLAIAALAAAVPFLVTGALLMLDRLRVGRDRTAGTVR